MANWNPFGWLLLVGGFLFGVVVGGTRAGAGLWLASYAAVLAGLAILTTNMLRSLWRSIRGRRVARARVHTQPLDDRGSGASGDRTDPMEPPIPTVPGVQAPPAN